MTIFISDLLVHKERLFNELKDIQPDEMFEFIKDYSNISVDLFSKAS